MAATALELEKQATADAKARKARTDDLVETYNDWKESAKKAKKPRLSPLDNNATSAAVVPPSPVRPIALARARKISITRAKMISLPRRQ